MLMSAFFKDIFQQNFKVQKSVYEICYCCITVPFNDKGQVLYYNVAVYILVQSEEEYSLIQKGEPLNGKKIDQKDKKRQNNGLL